MKIDFERPPINEVAIGMQFAPLINLRSEHVGVFWNRLRADFPTAQQVPPLGNIAQIPPEIFPMPRFWFVSKDDATLIQIQKGGFGLTGGSGLSSTRGSKMYLRPFDVIGMISLYFSTRICTPCDWSRSGTN